MPPRLLAGITLLFWGGMTDHALLGLIAALMVEARSWVSLRWDFTQTTYVRSWHYSILCGLLISILAWMNGMKVGRLHTLFIWAPLALLPIELAMRYGKMATIPLNTFSFFARKKMAEDLEQGRQVKPRMVNTGYAYISIVLLATAMGSKNGVSHMIGLNLIIAAALLFNAKKAGLRPWAWVLSMISVIALSMVGQWGIFKLYDYYRGASAGEGKSPRISANETRTSIGRLGKLKLSPHIFWRMKVHEGNVPKLLRVATYNQYKAAAWRYHSGELPENTQRDADGYLGAEDIDDLDLRIFRENDNTPPPEFPAQAHISIIGEIDARIGENPIPMPHFTHAIGDIGNLGNNAYLDCNTLGTIRLANPDYNVIEYRVWTGNHSTTEVGFQTTDKNKMPDDIQVPAREQAAIQRICDQLGLKQLPTTEQKIRKLRHFFNSEFTYSTHLTTPRLMKGQRQSAVGSFLESTRSGHCEYFATATALLLREAGVPTRYCIGFSVNEQDKEHDEWLMRGQHAHAWCRVWLVDKQHPDGGHWEDLDLTPPSWQNMGSGNKGLWQQRLADWWQRLYENFQIWRTHESNKRWVVTAVTVIITILTLWIIWRLWRSRQPKQGSQKHFYQKPTSAIITPLNQLEPKLAKTLGPRPTGVPLSRWAIQLGQIRPDLTDSMKLLCRLHDAARFDPLGVTEQERKRLSSECAALRKQLRKAKR